MSGAGRSILMICPDYKPNVGGEAELAFALAQALDARGSRVTVLAPAHLGGAPEDRELSGAVVRDMDLERFRPLSTPAGWLTWPGAMTGLVRTVRRLSREVAPEAVLVTTYMTWPTLAVRLSGLPYSLFLHGEDISLVERRGGWVERLFRRACRSAHRIFLNSEFSRRLLLRNFPELASISDAVGCAVRTDIQWTVARRGEARRALGWRDERPVLLTIANLYAKKGIHTVIHALPEIRRSHPGIRYVIVGEGPEEPALMALAEAQGVAGQIELRRRVDRETKEMLYAASDVYVMVSEPGAWGEEEGFGITFLEANWHGLPVVGSRCGGIPESVEHGVSGLIVEPGRPAELAAAVSRLLAAPILRQELARGGRRRIEERFNWPAIAGRVEAGLFSPAGPDR